MPMMTKMFSKALGIIKSALMLFISSLPKAASHWMHTEQKVEMQCRLKNKHTREALSAAKAFMPAFSVHAGKQKALALQW